jgi:hypothetical protein
VFVFSKQAFDGWTMVRDGSTRGINAPRTTVSTASTIGGLLDLTTEAYAGVVPFDGTMVALHWLTTGAVAEDRDE